MRLITSIFSFVSTFLPWRWQAVALELSRGIGWEPPMMMIASLGVIIPLNICIGLIGNNRLAATFGLSTTIIWFIISFIATGIVAVRCLCNIRRYGIFGFTRPTWWFECGRLALLVGLFAGIAFIAGFFLPFRDVIMPALLLTALGSAVLFVFAASVGFVALWTIRGRAKSKAFQCVHYFYCILIPFALMIGSAMCWPQPIFWPNGFLVICALVVSAFLCLCGMLSIASRYTQWEAERSKKQNIVVSQNQENAIDSKSSTSLM